MPWTFQSLHLPDYEPRFHGAQVQAAWIRPKTQHESGPLIDMASTMSIHFQRLFLHVFVILECPLAWSNQGDKLWGCFKIKPCDLTDPGIVSVSHPASIVLYRHLISTERIGVVTYSWKHPRICCQMLNLRFLAATTLGPFCHCVIGLAWFCWLLRMSQIFSCSAWSAIKMFCCCFQPFKFQNRKRQQPENVMGLAKPLPDSAGDSPFLNEASLRASPRTTQPSIRAH